MIRMFVGKQDDRTIVAREGRLEIGVELCGGYTVHIYGAKCMRMDIGKVWVKSNTVA